MGCLKSIMEHLQLEIFIWDFNHDVIIKIVITKLEVMSQVQ